MAKRKQINIMYIYDENWIAGVYYVCNIIKALNFLPNDQKPDLKILYCKNSLLTAIEAINYPYIEYLCIPNISLIKRVINKFVRMVFCKYSLLKVKLPNQLSNLFLADLNYNLANIKQPVVWIPDFQEKYLPLFFSKAKMHYRLLLNRNVVKFKFDIVFSSGDAKKDFDTFFAPNSNKKHVLKFVSIVDLNKLFQINEAELRNKYLLEKPYFIISNQFWAHKNHIVVLKALKTLKEKNPEILIIFTGKEYDNRNPEYTKDLKSFVHENNLDDNVKFLGFVDRMDQLALMRYSVSVIQPSLFEGWSTVVEDCKTIGKNIILSNLPVHIEQIDENVIFFDPSNEKMLDEILASNLSNNKIKNYTEKELIEKLEKRIINFANDFLSIFETK